MKQLHERIETYKAATFYSSGDRRLGGSRRVLGEFDKASRVTVISDLNGLLIDL